MLRIVELPNSTRKGEYVMLKCWECSKEKNENDAAYHVIETEDNDMEYVVCKSCVDKVVSDNFGEVHCSHCGKFLGYASYESKHELADGYYLNAYDAAEVYCSKDCAYHAHASQHERFKFYDPRINEMDDKYINRKHGNLSLAELEELLVKQAVDSGKHKRCRVFVRWYGITIDDCVFNCFNSLYDAKEAFVKAMDRHPESCIALCLFASDATGLARKLECDSLYERLPNH